MGLEVNDNDFLRQFEVEINGELAKIEYALQERKVFLTKLTIPESAEESFKDEFIRAVLKEIEEKNCRVVPTSPEIAKFLRKHRMIYKDLLPVGIRI
ncbi:hypothetical protein NBRC110019_28790 [Neptunitalea chrysea]|uniref:N-acetyltransferase domain-containing protein n=1 Tax=Neptunitalea chrysea TaxID=1647581 RepID=A0A9W6B747_9FLAO|nr:N-acetyltransferase [Neptunitalea chrysea]GLB53838.1 hypothetical protein NBRC110019_28790 [Neptunitalea chrysea]